MRVLKNCWYAAAWATEVPYGTLLGRRIVNEPVLFFRLENGAMAATADYCPHRFAPLHRGRQMGDVIQCGYHGLEFDARGKCMRNPHGSGVLPNISVRSYPVIDRYSVIWIWIGDRDADPSLISEEFAFLADSRRAHVRGRFHVKADYQLLLDNLMDISHALYLHGDALMTEDLYKNFEPKLSVEDDTVKVTLEQHGITAPGLFRPALPAGTQRVDFYDYVKHVLPSLVSHDIAYTQPGAAPYLPSGVSSRSAHFFTPETDSTSHYFFNNSRDFLTEDKATDQRVLAALQKAFGEEDIPMVEAQQRTLGDVDSRNLGRATLVTDRAAVAVRRALERKLKEQDGATAAATVADV